MKPLTEAEQAENQIAEQHKRQTVHVGLHTWFVIKQSWITTTKDGFKAAIALRRSVPGQRLGKYEEL